MASIKFSELQLVLLKSGDSNPDIIVPENLYENIISLQKIIKMSGYFQTGYLNFKLKFSPDNVCW